MSRLRHIAISVEDPWATAEFYMQAFGMKKIGEIDAPLAMGVYLSDGFINMAVLKYKTDELAGPRGKDWVGIHHMGFWVDDIDAAKAKMAETGAAHFAGEPSGDNSFYEVKYTDPTSGIIFDLTANGWGGAIKDVQAAASEGPKLARPDLKADRSQVKATVDL
jgi:catechol 2,3-dioxygenase-like lactoylglutathione lyase family enzyme